MKRAGQRGFSLLELGISTILLGLLITVLLDRFLYYQAVAEKAQTELTLRSLKAALRIRMSEMLIEGRAHCWSELVDANPFEWLERKPGNYCGEGNRVEAMPRGCWFFDTQNRHIIYRPPNGGRSLGEGRESLERYAITSRQHVESFDCTNEILTKMPCMAETVELTRLPPLRGNESGNK